MIHCFSGMGNSAAVANRLELKLPPNFPADIWVFPVYSWGVPPVVVKHIEQLDLTGRVCHMVCTCGDDTGNIDRQWRALIESRGGRAGSIYSVRMPNTYVCLPFMDVDSPSVVQSKLRAAEARVDLIAGRIADGVVETDINRGGLPGLKSGLIYPAFFRYLMKSGKFHVTAACQSCGRCISMCPNQNITADAQGRPQWGENCAFCLRCYHVCKAHAVAYGSQTRKKGQFLNPDFQWLTKKFKNLC